MLGAQGAAIRLFKFTHARAGDAWELYAASVSPSFYDANEDAAAAAPRWFLEAGDLEVVLWDLAKIIMEHLLKGNTKSLNQASNHRPGKCLCEKSPIPFPPGNGVGK